MPADACRRAAGRRGKEVHGAGQQESVGAKGESPARAGLWHSEKREGNTAVEFRRRANVQVEQLLDLDREPRGIQLTAFQAGVIGLGIAYSAYQAENFRAGIGAIDPGQIEAAQSLGMQRSLILRRVILPQAFRITLPPLREHDDRDAQGLLAGLGDHGGRTDPAGRLIASSTFKNTSVFTLVALLYLSR